MRSHHALTFGKLSSSTPENRRMLIQPYDAMSAIEYLFPTR